MLAGAGVDRIARLYGRMTRVLGHKKRKLVAFPVPYRKQKPVVGVVAQYPERRTHLAD